MQPWESQQAKKFRTCNQSRLRQKGPRDDLSVYHLQSITFSASSSVNPLQCIAFSASSSMHHFHRITFSASPSVHHLQCITFSASPSLHHLQCITFSASAPVFPCMTHGNIIFDILEQSSFQKYATCWVFLALYHMLYLCICIFVFLYLRV